MRWLLILLASAMPLMALAAEEDSRHRCSPEGIALGGYDLISYRQTGGPFPGNEKYRAEHGGLSYLFASAGNLSMFTAAPVDYLPRYRGWPTDSAWIEATVNTSTSARSGCNGPANRMERKSSTLSTRNQACSTASFSAWFPCCRSRGSCDDQV